MPGKLQGENNSHPDLIPVERADQACIPETSLGEGREYFQTGYYSLHLYGP